MSPRPYRVPPARRQAADQTRLRILAAARDLLATPAGVQDFSLQAVGEAAGVTRLTHWVNVLSLTLQTEYGGCERIRPKREGLDCPTEREQNQGTRDCN